MSGAFSSTPIPMSSMWLFAGCGPKSTTHSKRNSSTPFAVLAMLSNRAKPRSIATQLVLLFTVCAVLLLSCSLGLFYWIVVRHAFEEDNAVLADKVAAIRTELRQPAGINALAQELKNPRTGEAAIYWIRIMGPDGNTIMETPGMDRVAPAFLFPS